MVNNIVRSQKPSFNQIFFTKTNRIGYCSLHYFKKKISLQVSSHYAAFIQPKASKTWICSSLDCVFGLIHSHVFSLRIGLHQRPSISRQLDNETLLFSPKKSQHITNYDWFFSLLPIQKSFSISHTLGDFDYFIQVVFINHVDFLKRG